MGIVVFWAISYVKLTDKTWFLRDEVEIIQTDSQNINLNDCYIFGGDPCSSVSGNIAIIERKNCEWGCRNGKTICGTSGSLTVLILSLVVAQWFLRSGTKHVRQIKHSFWVKNVHNIIHIHNQKTNQNNVSTTTYDFMLVYKYFLF